MIAAIYAALIFLLMMAVPRDSEAECARVLWAQTQEHGFRGWWNGPQWTADSAYESKEACDNAHVIRYERGKDGKLVKKDDPLAGKRGLGTNWTCLPDTVDPRGPKGGAR